MAITVQMSHTPLLCITDLNNVSALNTFGGLINMACYFPELFNKPSMAMLPKLGALDLLL